MRDPKRMKRILDKLENCWSQCEDWRLNQLMFNIHGDRGDTFYMEDDEFEKRLDNFISIYIDNKGDIDGN